MIFSAGDLQEKKTTQLSCSFFYLNQNQEVFVVKKAREKANNMNNDSSNNDAQEVCFFKQEQKQEDDFMMINKKRAMIPDLETLVKEIRAIFSKCRLNKSLESPDLLQEIMSVMASYDASEKRDWKRFTSFDPQTYSRVLLDDDSSSYHLMMISWSEGQASKIHDHPCHKCVMKVSNQVVIV